MRARLPSALSVLLVAVLALSASPPAAQASAAAATPPARSASEDDPLPSKVRTITLLTGDRVHLQNVPGGRQVATIQPADGREDVDFHQSEIDGDLYVFPLDVFPYLSASRLERDLFNVSELLRQGADDQSTTSLPLILEYAASARMTSTPKGATAGAKLESLRAEGVRLTKKNAAEFWKTVAEPTARLGSDLKTIHLDRKVRAQLDRSVPQIGAPKAWEGGYTGKGATVAVLDTGVDQNHPDLREAVADTKNFSDSPSNDDEFGHGTHVSSIIAGRGAADPKHKGVAPESRLIVGKVLNDKGVGFDSWILNGMEWAADSGAKVVNLSLGGSPTDGTDPLSRGLNEISERTGTLFVVAAGNDGPGDQTVGTPGSADHALTVGAVDRDESLAPFSSRGPRVGDFAVKPNITAPGVGISAARAGSDDYVGMSGTSMAAPHVAGAAALLAQQHPDWPADRLTDALVSTAQRNPNSTAFQQGGGRVDVGRAVEQQVYGTGTLDLGSFPADQKAAGKATVSYTNVGDQPVDLRLALSMPSAGQAVELDRTDVRVPAGGSAEVGLTIDPAKLSGARHQGYLEATAEGVAVHTTLGAMKESPRHTVTLTGVGTDGQPAFTNPVAIFGTDSRFDYFGSLNAGRTIQREVAEGTYDVYGVVKEKRDTHDALFVIQNPALEVDRDRDVVFDARKANRVQIHTPQPARQDGNISLYSSTVLHGQAGAQRRISHYRMDFEYLQEIYAAPTPALPEGDFEFGTRWSLIRPRLTMRTSDGSTVEPSYLRNSPALEGKQHLPIVSVGAGQPEDYENRDVGGKVALVNAVDSGRESHLRRAAEHGAAMALIAVPETARPIATWRPDGTREPAMGALISHKEGERLLGLLRAGSQEVILDGTPSSPYLYDVLQISRGRVPEEIIYRAGTDNTAEVTTEYPEGGGFDWQKEQRFGWRPWQDAAINQYQRFVRTPGERREYVSAGDTIWQHRVRHHYSFDTINPLSGGLTELPRTYRAGEKRTESWFAPVARPNIPAGLASPASVREGDTLRFRIPAWGDAEPGHYGHYESDLGGISDRGTVRLSRDGEQIAEARNAQVDLDAGKADNARYRLDFEVERTSPHWSYGTKTDTSWEFDSARGSKATALPLLQLDYHLPTDPNSSAAAGEAFAFSLNVRNQAGLPEPEVSKATVEVSYDGGQSWKAARVAQAGRSELRVVVDQPARESTDGFATLRIRAADRAGNTVEQTVHRAYGLR